MSEISSAIIAGFVDEGNEKADRIEQCLLDLEKKPGSNELLAEVFRAMHSLKGATSFLGFTKLCALAHAGESLLTRLRDGSLQINPDVTNALLSLVDVMRDLLSEIAATGSEGCGDHSALFSRLKQL
ncbi:MAG: Hpt domain-containing protein [Candidatus Acidiferrum sp.]